MEVWIGTEHLGTLPAELLFQVVRHYLHGARLQSEVASALHHLGEPLPALSPAPPEPCTPSPIPRLPAAKGRRLRGR